MGFGLLPALLVVTLRSYLTGLKLTQVIFWITVMGIPLKIFLNWVFIFGNLGMDEMGIRGAAFTTTAVHLFMLVLLIFYIQNKLRTYLIFNRLWRLDYLYLAKIVKLGLPIGLTYLAETSLFTTTAVMMGWLGTIQLAAHGITMQLAGLTFMFHVGLSQAATTITGYAFGKNEGSEELRRIGKATILLTIAYAFVIMLFFLLFPEFLLSLFLDESLLLSDQILSLATNLLMIAALFHLVDGLQAVGLGLLRGIQDVKIPSLLAIISYWFFGIGSGYLLGFEFKLGSIGLWIGMVIGLTVAASSLIWRYWRKAST
jgi:MATE family multidrug resistance protein